MNRYKHQQVKRDADGRRKLSTIQYPKIVSKNSDMIYRTRQSDTYSGLAYRFYSDQSLWWIIAQANNIFDGSIYLDTSKQIRVPVNISGVLIDLENINRLF